MGTGSFHRSGASLRGQMVNIKENHYKTERKKRTPQQTKTLSCSIPGKKVDALFRDPTLNYTLF